MKKPSLQEVVLKKTLPNPKGNEPTTFFGHVQRNLVPEVRHEVQVFYGSLDCLEAQYPGLDYTFAPHRRRLSRYTWHRRLFRTFDDLGLTDHEILSLCQWEGTRSAKERYEAETKRKIIDTTADDIAKLPVSEGPRARAYNWSEPEDNTDTETATEIEAMDFETPMEQSDDDEVSSSVGVQLNQQLQAAVEARSRGEEATVDAQWEQWMKEALERNDLDRDSILQAIREGRPLSQFSSAPVVNQGEYIRPEEIIGPIMPTPQLSPSIHTATTLPQPQIARQFSDLRSMLSSLQSANNQLAADNAQLAMLLSRSQPETAR